MWYSDNTTNSLSSCIWYSVIFPTPPHRPQVPKPEKHIFPPSWVQVSLSPSPCSFATLYFGTIQLGSFLRNSIYFCKNPSFAMKYVVERKADHSPSTSPGAAFFTLKSSHPRVLQFFKQKFLIILHHYQIQENCQNFRSFWTKLKRIISHDGLKDELNGSY